MRNEQAPEEEDEEEEEDVEDEEERGGGESGSGSESGEESSDGSDGPPSDGESVDLEQLPPDGPVRDFFEAISGTSYRCAVEVCRESGRVIEE